MLPEEGHGLVFAFVLVLEPEMISVPMSEKVDPLVFSVASFNLFSVGVFLAGLATLMSSWDRYRWRTIGLLVGFVVVQMVFKVISLASEPLRWLGRLTFWSAYEPERFVNLAVRWPEQAWSWTPPESSDLLAGPLAYNALLIGMGIVCFLAAARIFRQRDLPAPL